MAEDESSASPAQRYDLTQTVGPYLDRHMLVPLLDFLREKKTYPADELDRGKLQVLFRTNMVDLAMDIYKALHATADVPQNMSDRREEVVGLMAQLSDEVQPILELVQDAGRVHDLQREKLFNQSFLQEQHAITPTHVKALQRYAKFVYDCGDYGNASNLLVPFRLLTTNPEDAFSAQWGKLACEILMTNWDQAFEDINALKEAIEARGNTPAIMQLQQRAWLMHWSLFLLGNHPNGRNFVAELFFSDRYLNAIQTTCPHLLRYLAVAVLTTPRRRGMLKELVRVISMERHAFSDPITQFLEDLYKKADFEQAQQRLQECAAVLDNDFFLCNSEQDFLKSARLYIFENYCRIHERIDLSMLAKKLNMEHIAAEKWIVKMVSDAQLNAKIDSQSGHVILGVQPPDVYQQVIEKTKGLSFRSYVLAQNIEKRSLSLAASMAS
uniref:Eukaryotic translation initiation factor 3 subunit E n=1 Tax=Calcidiscus leptoporus TaxID=127549 RepID=A0A7S0IPH7_9EUKA